MQNYKIQSKKRWFIKNVNDYFEKYLLRHNMLEKNLVIHATFFNFVIWWISTKNRDYFILIIEKGCGFLRFSGTCLYPLHLYSKKKKLVVVLFPKRCFYNFIHPFLWSMYDTRIFSNVYRTVLYHYLKSRWID